MTAFGISPLGTGPLGGPGTIAARGVLPSGNNEFVVVFDTLPKTNPSTRPGSALNVANYALSAIDPTILTGNGQLVVPKGYTVPTRAPSIVNIEQDDDDDTQFILYTDCMLEPGVDYMLDVSPQICGINEEDWYGDTQFTFRALGRPAIPRTASERAEDRYRDFDYGPVDEDGNAAYRIDGNGDIGIQNSTLSLQKRIQRRLLTPKGGFAWSKDYGTFSGLKSLARQGQLQALANRISEQLRQEPDVADAAAETRLIRNERGSFVEVIVYVRTRSGTQEKISFQVNT